MARECFYECASLHHVYCPFVVVMNVLLPGTTGIEENCIGKHACSGIFSRSWDTSGEVWRFAQSSIRYNGLCAQCLSRCQVDEDEMYVCACVCGGSTCVQVCVNETRTFYTTGLGSAHLAVALPLCASGSCNYANVQQG